MKWKQWKIGAAVALLLSLFVAGMGLTGGMNWRGFVVVFCAAAVTHFGAYLKDHPADQISFDTKPPLTPVPSEQSKTANPS